MKKIKNITVATDLSVTARNAYRYARELAKALEATLTIVHIKESVFMGSDIPSEDEKELVNDIEEMVTEENAATPALPSKQEVKIKILPGDPVHVLTELSEKTDLIVIGTTGLADVLTKLFGSVSLNVSKKAHCPVILVPRDAKWQAIKQILFASSYSSATAEFLKQISGFAMDINAGIHFVNVKNVDPTTENKERENEWNEYIPEVDAGLRFEKHTIYGKDTIQELQFYSKEKNIDLMAFASKNRTFWENLAHKSTTENMALSATLPILVIHADDESISNPQ